MPDYTEKTSVLQDGKYTRYYACNYDDWKKDTLSLYNKFNETFEGTYDKAIDKHEKIAEGVYKTTFEGGKAVVVNYNYSNYQYNGQEIAARDFAAVKGGEE